MPKTTGANPLDQRALIGRLKLCVALLVGLCVLFGALCAYLLRSLDRNYADLIDHSVPVINELRALNKQALSAQRGILASLVRVNEPGREDALKGIRVAIAADRKIRARILLQSILQDGSKHALILNHTGEDYDQAATDVVNLLAQGRNSEADKVRHEMARPALNLYLNCIESAANYVENTSQRISDEYTEGTQSQSAILLGLAGLPLFIAGVIIMAVFAAIFMMWLVLRRAGFDDGP